MLIPVSDERTDFARQSDAHLMRGPTTGRKGMHKSRLAGFIIDCQTDDVEQAAAFWGAALGLKTHYDPATGGENYVRLIDPNERLHIEVQKVSHPSRVHLDIETDDVEAEVKRLEALGAKLVERVRSWCVMEAPTGQRFCVVRPQSHDFAERAHRWS